ncbi:MAG: sigma-70 family RNA polymerase sigma factor [Myxococcales bacterium]|nr:sigma-70 family RNA polymerase sigma factor [Myxococcales bacterium]
MSATQEGMDSMTDTAPVVSEEQQLVDEAKTGARAPLEKLIRRFNQPLFRIARAQLKDDAEAEEITQQAWVQIVSALHQWNGRGTFAAWAATVVVNACRQRRRGARDDAPLDETDELEGTLPAPDEEVQRAEVGRVLERTVDELSTPLRLVFVMRDVQGLSGSEVAEALGITEELVRVRLHRARQALRVSLDSQFQGEARQLFPFLGARCDRITHAVLAAVGATDA